jgi:hypothetical protein
VTKPSVLDLPDADYAAARTAALRPRPAKATPAAPPSATDMDEPEWRRSRLGNCDVRDLSAGEYEIAKATVLRAARRQLRR